MSISQTILDAKQYCRDGKLHDALRILNTARIKQNHPALLIEMAHIFIQMNNTDAAWTTLETGIAHYPDDAAMIHAYGNLAYHTDHIMRGLNITTPAIKNHPDVLITHAHLLKASGQTAEAEKIYNDILQRDPANIIARSSLGGLYMDAQDYEKAIAFFLAALTYEPNNAHIRTQLAYSYFRSGNLHDGWTMYAARFADHAVGGTVTRQRFSAPSWNGQRMDHGTLVIWGEQAAGEEILYASMIDDARKHCTALVIECDVRLKPLFERSFPGIPCIARSTPSALPTDITAQCSSGELGQFFRNDFSDFPQRAAYLKADEHKVAQLRARYMEWKKQAGKTGRVIGVSWKSKPLRHGDPKSTSLDDWALVFDNSPHFFISLQYGDIADDLMLAKQNNWALVDDSMIDQRASLDDFAAQVCAMDAVITVSNTTAHMAGACGIHTAVLLPKSRGLIWHWFDTTGLDRHPNNTLATSPWYPTVTLLRQTTDGVWKDVIQAAHTMVLYQKP